MVLAEGWEEVLSSLPGILSVTFIFGGWIIVVVVASIAKNWRKVHESEHLAALKQSMIERGMSADEIERVLRAGPASSLADSGCNSGDTSGFSKKLAEHELPPPAIEQILGAYRSANPSTRKTLANTVEAMLDGGADGEQVMAAVRAIARPGTEATHEAPFRDDPASYRH
jgi:hypothetical protein